MEKKEYLTKPYRHFADLVSISAYRELGFYILDSRFTKDFCDKLSETINDVSGLGRDGTAFNVVFNTEGEIAIIDAEILGKFISNSFNIGVTGVYKGVSLNRIVRNVINGTDKVKNDFVIIAYSILYNTLGYIYSEISYNKSLTEKYKKLYNMGDYVRNDFPIIIGVILIMEDICKYMDISQEYLKNCITNEIKKKL